MRRLLRLIGAILFRPFAGPEAIRSGNGRYAEGDPMQRFP
jgi:hypothetical protein